MRLWRAERIQELAKLLQIGPGRRDTLLGIADCAGIPPQERSALLCEAENLDIQIANARHDITEFRAVPSDHDSTCRCGDSEHHTLPEALAVQLMNLDSLPASCLGIRYPF